MKFIIIVFLCVILESLAHHLSEDEKLKLKQVHDSCQANPSTYVDEDKLRNLPNYIEDRQVGIHMLCMSIKAGLQQPNGELNKGVIRSKVALVTHDQSKVDGLVDKCAVKIENPEKTAVMLWLCFVKNNVHYIHKL